MAQKRGHGEGAVRYNDNKSYWEARFTYDDPISGGKKRRMFTGKSQREALTKGRSWLREIENGLLPDADKLTLGVWLDRWIDDYVKGKTKPKTLEKYQSQVKLYIKPILGDVLITKVKGPDVQRMYNKLTEAGGKKCDGLSCYTVRNVHVCLHAAFDQALKDGLVTRNPIETTEPPRMIRHEVKPLSVIQAKILLKAAEKAGSMEHVIILLALETGMRKGEIFGLKWQDIDSEKATISVQRSLATTGQGIFIQEPKDNKKSPDYTGYFCCNKGIKRIPP
jgi:integrase